jgi:hypothetical protein
MSIRAKDVLKFAVAEHVYFKFEFGVEYSFRLLLFVIVVPDYFPFQNVLSWQLPNPQTGFVVGPDFFTLTWRKT